MSELDDSSTGEHAPPTDERGAGHAQRVAITGYGTVGPHGCGREALRRAFRAGPPRLTEVDRSAGYHRDGARFAALVDPAALADHLSPRQARRSSPPSRYAVVAARLAIEDARSAGDSPAVHDDSSHGPTAVVTSTAFGPSSFTEQLLRQILLDTPTAASPSLFTEAVANAPAARIALALGARGPNITVTQREAGPLLALAQGARQVAQGRAARAIVAAVDEANPLLHAALDRFGALSGSRRRSASQKELGRPFDRHRDGFVLGEGATALVLEPVTAALDRGARILATIEASVAAFDPAAPRAGYATDPGPLAGRLLGGLGRAAPGAGPNRAVLPTSTTIVAGAAGSRAGDRLEARVLRRAWGARPLPDVLAPKATTGEHGAGLLAGAMLALEGAEWAPTPGFETPDPDLHEATDADGGPSPFRPWAGGPTPDSEYFLLSALAVGGAAAWTLLRRGSVSDRARERSDG